MNKRTPIVALLAAMALFALAISDQAQTAPSTAQATTRSDPALRKRQTEARNNYERIFAQMPVAPGTFDLHDLLQLRQDGPNLVCAPALPKDQPPGQFRVKCKDPDSVVIASVMAGGNLAPQPQSGFSLSQTTFSDPQALQVQAAVSYMRPMLTISYCVQGDRGDLTISLQQLVAGPQDHVDSPGVTLTITEASAELKRAAARNHGAFPQPPRQETLTAPDFATLRSRHAQTVSRYLRPALIELGMENVLIPQPLLAWQVLADQWKPDPRVTMRVPQLLEKLDADDFQERESAALELRKIGTDGILVLAQSQRGKLTPQQTSLLDAILKDYDILPAKKAAALASDRDFLLDCLYSDQLAIRQAALVHINQIATRTIALDLKADAAARGKAIEQIRHTPELWPATAPVNEP